MKLSNKLLIGFIAILVGLLLCQAIISARVIKKQQKEKTEQPIK